MDPPFLVPLFNQKASQLGANMKLDDEIEKSDNLFFDKLIPSNITINSEVVPIDADFAWLLFLLFLSLLWTTYALYYNARLLGLIITKLTNNVLISRYFYPNTKRSELPHFSVSSFSVTFIAGKIMVRDLIWITTDHSIRVQDGWLIFSWWQSFEPRDIQNTDFSHSDARISLFLNGFEHHIYNRSELYAELEKIFGINPPKLNLKHPHELKNTPNHDGELTIDKTDPLASAKSSLEFKGSEDLIKAYLWRNFFPLTKIEISTGRWVFGNHLIPSTLLITFEEGNITYTSRPAVSPHDLFTHIAKAKAESFKVILAPSPKYAGLVEEPPRFMGEGFIVFQTNLLDLYYYQDEPGMECKEPEKIELPTGDIDERYTSPAWGLDIKCGKGTHFGYGPWADRNRDYLYNFFYPPNFKLVKPDPRPPPGQLRQFESFYIRLSTLADAAIDILFINKEKETKALHVNAGPGSYLEVSLPYISSETGYETHIVGQILHLDATTNLNFRSLAESETLEFKIDLQYPLVWNDHQTWNCSLTGCKATIDLIFAHKVFFQNLIEDWSVKDRPELMQFIPYTWKFTILLKEFELITLANEYNWIDCLTKLNSENAQVAICGDVFDMSFDLPFNEFLPVKLPVKIWIQGESLNASLHLPECNPHRDSIFMLDKYAKLCPYLFDSAFQDVNYATINTSDLFCSDKKWRRFTKRENGWIDCWTVPIVALSITYNSYPVPPKTYTPKSSEITTPEREDLLLDPIRPEKLFKSDAKSQAPADFDPGKMDPDLIELELEVGPSKICLYGALFRLLWNIKENYVGESQEFTDFNSNPNVADAPDNKNRISTAFINPKPFDPRLYRPLAVTISVTLHNIQGYLMKCCNESNSGDLSPCPYLYLERLAFEMDKRYSETKMQLLLSPLTLDAPEYTFFQGRKVLTNTGHMKMDSLQFRGHAMFSDLDRPLDSETLEYAWLIEVHVGDISGKLSPSQLHQILICVETIFAEVLQEDCSLQPPTPYQKCLHDIVQSLCPKTQESDNKMCPYSEDIKYRMVRVDIDNIRLFLAEKNSVLGLEIQQIKLCTCNLHSCHTSSGMTALVKETNLHHYMKPFNLSSNFRSSKIHLTNGDNSSEKTFYEVANMNVGTAFIDSVELLSAADKFTVSQDTFLRQHDQISKRLWFLWPEIAKKYNCMGKCGCVGGCVFFGNNCRGVNFFSFEKNDLKLSSIVNDKEILWGESLLKPNEPVPGFKIGSIICSDEEDIGELAPLIRPNFRLPSPLSPSNLTSSKSTFEFPLQNKSPLTLQKMKMPPYTRQVSSPSAVNFPPSKSDTLGPSSSTVNSKLVFQFKEQPRNRSLSETDDINRVDPDNGDQNKKGVMFIQLSDSQPTSGSLKTSFSYITPTENQYVTAPESLPSSLRGSETFVTGDEPIVHVLSDDTFNSVQSITASNETSTLLDNVSLSHSALDKSRMSIQSTHSAPPNPGKLSHNNAKDPDNASISSSSFISAVSSQEENEIDAMVDLRNQMEKPIIESALLMSSYANYLTRYKCSNYRAATTNQDVFTSKGRRKEIPKFGRSSNEGLSLVKLTEKQSFEYTTNNDGKKENKEKEKSKNEDSCFVPGSVYQKIDRANLEEQSNDKSENLINDDNSEAMLDKRLQKDFNKTVDFKTEKLTILVRFDGVASIRLSPLCLDGLKTLITDLTESFASIHPLTVINHLNMKGFSYVSAKNQLKKRKTLEYGQLKHKAWASTLERENFAKGIVHPIGSTTARTKFGEAFQDMKSQFKTTQSDTTMTVNQCEENRQNEFQAFFQLSGIHFIVLQASVVEELIAFSALDEMKDLTCVSMLSVNLNRLNFDCYNSIKERRSLHTIISNNIRSQPTSAFAQFAQSDIVSRLLFRKPKKEQTEVEPVTIETHELLEKEMVAIGGIGSIHVQLTRLKNNSNILKDAILTVVPQNKSKVNFKHAKYQINESNRHSTNTINRRRSSGANRTLRRQDGVENRDNDIQSFVDSKNDINNEIENTIYSGFIMFESGLEGISIKAIKKLEMDNVPSNTSETLTNENSDKNNSKSRNEKKEASSFFSEINEIWFNFAAPPKTPNTRKIDYTRLDWHLLSTATPAINAWMSAGDRFLVTLKEVASLYEQRAVSIITYLMISAIEADGIHKPPQSKCYIRKMTPYSKALQEDPSCQLMNVLRRYLLSHASMKEVDNDLQTILVPPLHVLRRGLVAASRQWKNSLYMPLLVEQNIRQNKEGRESSSIFQSVIPLRLLFENASKSREEGQIKPPPEKIEAPDKEVDSADEKTNLIEKNSKDLELDEEFLTFHDKNNTSQPEIVVTSGIQSPANEEIGLTSGRRKHTTLPNIFGRPTRGSVAPLLTYPLESLGTGVNKAYEFLFNQNSHQSSASKNKREGSQISLKSISTSSDLEEGNAIAETIFSNRPLDSSTYQEENLYLWMSRQQDYMETKNLHQLNSRRTSNFTPNNIDIEQARQNTLGSAYSNEEEAIPSTNPVLEIPPGFVFVPTGVQLNNVMVIFQPLFKSLGIENLNEEGEPGISFDQLGPKIALSLLIRLFKVNIAESDLTEAANPPCSKSPASGASLHPTKNSIKHDQTSSPVRKKLLDDSAFYCDRLALNLELRKVHDSNASENSENPTKEQPDDSNVENKPAEEKVPILIVGPDGGINEVTTMINFSVDVHQIVQRVNLPLLRLLHQVASMYESIKETRYELKANRRANIKESASKAFNERLNVDINNLCVTPSLTSLAQTEKKISIDGLKETIIHMPNSNEEDSTEIPMSPPVIDQTDVGISDVILRPKCWKTMYYLLDLYEITPETKTVNERGEKAISMPQSVLESKIGIEDDDEVNKNRQKGGYEQLKDNFSDGDDQSTPTTGRRKVSFEAGYVSQRKSMNIVSSDKLKNFTQALIHREMTPLVVFGVTKIEKVNLTAMLGGLKLDGELSSFHVSLTHKSKMRGAALHFKKWKESSLTGHLGQSNFSLYEEFASNPSVSSNQQIIVKMTIGKSQTLISSQNKKGKDANSVLFAIGAISIDIPQHPIALHGMVTRSTKQLSSTLQELRSSRQPSRTSHQQTDNDQMASSFSTSFHGTNNLGASSFQSPTKEPSPRDLYDSYLAGQGTHDEMQKLIKPIIFQFTLIFDSFTIGSSLLPSLRAQYQIGQITSSGIMGTKAKFVVDIKEHTLSFNTTLAVSESNLPSSANVSMPPIHVSAEYMEDETNNRGKIMNNGRPESFAEGIVLRKGSYLNAIADIGSLEHTLTTDLLNHLLLVQKVFMKEVNEVVQKMSGYESKVIDPNIGGFNEEANPLYMVSSSIPSKSKTLLFSLNLRMKGVQITATTPTNSALRLESGAMELQLSNRVQNMSSNFRNSSDVNQKLFIKLQVDLNFALGQLIRNAMFEEADPEFQQLAFFRTRIVLRNALQDEMVPSSVNDGKEALLITLNHPCVYIQPLALDKAVFVWLNYKNAYEYWNEQRSNLNKEVLSATQQVLDKVPQIPQISSQNLGTLFLQLTIVDLGICLPISNPAPFQGPGYLSSKSYDADLRSAFVVTLENTRISACSCGSLVSKGRFNGLCFRFVDDFDPNHDDWKPDSNCIVMNKCQVSEGTYEICSKTITHTTSSFLRSDAKWVLNVSWKMDGFDIHVDTSIGKQFSALFKTLTAIAGDEDESDTFDYSDVVDESSSNYNKEANAEKEVCPSTADSELSKVNLRRMSLFKDTSIDHKRRSRLIEKELNEQAKTINDLRQLGASQSTIEQEIKRLLELESAVYNDFKRDIIKKFRRTSVKKSFRDKMKFPEGNFGSSIAEDKPDYSTESTKDSDKTLPSPTSTGTIQTESFKSDQDQKSPDFVWSRSLTEAHDKVSLSNVSQMASSYPSTSTSEHSKPISLSLFSHGNSSHSSNSSGSRPTTSSSSSDNLLLSSATYSGSSPTDAPFTSFKTDYKPPHSSSTLSNASPTADEASNCKNDSQKLNFESKDAPKDFDASGSHTKSNYQVQDPFIDFELDVKVFFKSGQCVFHTKDPNKDIYEDHSKRNGLPKERSFTGNLESLASPSHQIPRQGAFRSSITNNKHGHNSKNNLSSTRLRYPSSSISNTNLTEFSSFAIPGLDIKVHYNSKTVFVSPNNQPIPTETNVRFTSESRESEQLHGIGQTSFIGKRIGTKKASCYAWMTLHRIAKETLITPHILDFMEQALEPIHIPVQPSAKTASPATEVPPNNAENTGRADLITSAPAQYAVYGSFPVDVIVYLHMQPSVLRFSCLPVSRVECLLQLPSVDFVISSKRSQDELNPSQASYTSPSFKPPCGSTRVGESKYSHRRTASDYRHPQYQTETPIGGLSMTGCLADFSLYIFHPYGGQNKASSNTSLSPPTLPSTSSKSTSDRKDSLSLQVEFVKINISRSRRLVWGIETSPISKSMQSSSHASQEKLNHVVYIRFSALCDIGSASFKYDMRRLTEILAFPKAWYRKAIWKRMFLGDQSLTGQNVFSDEDFRDYNISSSSSAESFAEDYDESKNKYQSTGNIHQKSSSTTANPQTQFTKTKGDRKSLWLDFNDLEYGQTGVKLRNKDCAASFSSNGTFQQQRQLMNAPWKTYILFGVNLCKLNVHMNMGNVMGNTSWLTRGFRSEGRISIDSSGYKSINVSLGLDGSSLDAKGGIVGGIFEINQIQTRVGIKENYGKEPDHVVTLQLDALEKRLDYMGTSILMLRVSDLDLTLRDEWLIDNHLAASNHPTHRPACIFIHCNLCWDQLQILMSKSTTPDIIKIVSKLEEFFSQQFHSSKRVFSALKPTASSSKSSSVNRNSFRDRKDRNSLGKGKPSTPVSYSAGTESEVTSQGSGSSIGGTTLGGGSGSGVNIVSDAKHHRHWQKVLKIVSGASLSTLASPLPRKGTILGGTFELNGNNISLACFYGINFRPKSWAIFSLRKPSISFASEAQDVVNSDSGSTDTHTIQNFSLSLGRRGRRREQDEKPFTVDCFYAQHSNMATVCKISRNIMYPPQFKTMHEWFQYTFADSELDQIDRFPVIEFERSGDGFGSAASSIPNRRISINPKTGEYHHSKEVIFALPSLQLDLKTEHLQGERISLLSEPKPRVDCTFVTDFDDHIFVAVDAEAYFFLHDLIQSYIKEKQSDRFQSRFESSPRVDSDTKSSKTSVNHNTDLEAYQSSNFERDWREFNCQTWHLEPTVRLVTWGGKSIEPYGVDYILQRLGFTQARTTIPKWIQRGAMDPLDKVLSAIMQQVISAAKNEPSSDHRNS